MRNSAIYGGILVGILVCLIGSSASAQSTFGASPPLPGERGAERVTRIFDEVSPELGAPLPDLVCYDAKGSKFRLRTLEGHYSVLMFGCLT